MKLRRVGLLLVALASINLLGVAGAATQEAKLLASDGGPGELFGLASVVDGDTAAVGASEYSAGRGSVYVFTRTGSTWTEQAHLFASDGAAGDRFGSAMSLDGDTLVIGAVQDDAPSPNQGSVYVFTRTGSTWTQQAKINPSDAAANDLFGISVDVDGDTLVAGAYGDDVTAANQGSAYVFTRSGSTWTQQAKITASDGSDGDEFGVRVALDGDTIVSGARFDDIGATALQGSAYVFTRTGSIWTQQAHLTASDGTFADEFGLPVDVEGDTVLVAARLANPSISSGDEGAVYVYTRTGSTWTQQAQLAASDGAGFDQFGIDIDLEGETAVIGAYTDDIGANSNQGSAYLFTRSGSTWAQQEKITAGDGAAQDEFGIEVSLYGNTVLIGSRGDDVGVNSNQGSAYVYTLDSDADGVRDATDNCPGIVNPGQENNDSDAEGDACDGDDDNDGVADTSDNCPLVANPGQANNDGDAEGDACDGDDDNDGVADGPDNCDFIANPGQADLDEDGIGDACDPDADGDGIPDTARPTNKEQCKKDGWRAFNNPTFKNQGDCVSYLATGGRTPNG